MNKITKINFWFAAVAVLSFSVPAFGAGYAAIRSSDGTEVKVKAYSSKSEAGGLNNDCVNLVIKGDPCLIKKADIVGWVDISWIFPRTIDSEELIEPIRQRVAAMKKFVKRFPDSEDLLKTDIEIISDMVEKYNNGMVKWRGEWVTREVGAQALAQAQAQAQASAQARAQAEAEAQVQAQAQASAQARAEAQAKARAKAQAQALEQAQARARAQAQAEVEAQVQAQAQASAQARAEARAEAQAKALAQAQAVIRAQAEAIVQAEAAKEGAVSSAIAQAEARAEARAEAQAEDAAWIKAGDEQAERARQLMEAQSSQYEQQWQSEHKW